MKNNIDKKVEQEEKEFEKYNSEKQRRKARHSRWLLPLVFATAITPFLYQKVKAEEDNSRIVGGFTAGLNSEISGELGIEYKGLSLTGKLSSRPDEPVKTVERELMNNVWFKGSKANKKNWSIGGLVSYAYPWSNHIPFFKEEKNKNYTLSSGLGLGLGADIYNRTSEVSLTKNPASDAPIVMAKNSDSFAEVRTYLDGAVIPLGINASQGSLDF